MDLPQKLRRTVELLDACDFSHERVSTKAAKEQMTKAATEIERLKEAVNELLEKDRAWNLIHSNLQAQLAEMRAALKVARDESGITLDALDVIEKALATDAGKAAADVLAAAVVFVEAADSDQWSRSVDKLVEAVHAYREERKTWTL